MEWLSPALTIVGFAATSVATAVVLTRKLSEIEKELRGDMVSYRDDVRRDMVQYRDEVAKVIDADRRAAGEALQALRQKINDVELEGAKTYSRRESFHQAMGQLQESIGKSDQAAEQRMLRIEEKIDRLSDRVARVAAHVPGGQT